MRVVVDTNVWISAVLNPAGPPAGVTAALVRKAFTLVTSEPLLAELAEVLARPRFTQRYRVASADIADLISLLREGAEIAAVFGAVHLCRDPDDDVVIETSRSGRATTMVSRDDDLKRDWDLIELLAAEGIEVPPSASSWSGCARKNGTSNLRPETCQRKEPRRASSDIGDPNGSARAFHSRLCHGVASSAWREGRLGTQCTGFHAIVSECLMPTSKR